MPSTLNYGRQTIAELEINPGPHWHVENLKIVESHMSLTVTLLMTVVTFYDTLFRVRVRVNFLANHWA